MSGEFDPERFETLAKKAERGELTDSAAEELREQLEAFNAVMRNLIDAMMPAVRDAVTALGEALEPLAEMYADADAAPSGGGGDG